MTLDQAVHFATDRHRGQTRKDAAKSPYITHIHAVLAILREHGAVTDEDILIAGALHDTVEDTATTFEEIGEQFGPIVLELVREMTDDKSLPKAARKRLQIVHAPHCSPGAKQLKLADKIANIRDIARTPPTDWSIERRREYFDWAEAVAAGCRGVNAGLDVAFDDAVALARLTL